MKKRLPPNDKITIVIPKWPKVKAQYIFYSSSNIGLTPAIIKAKKK